MIHERLWILPCALLLALAGCSTTQPRTIVLVPAPVISAEELTATGQVSLGISASPEVLTGTPGTAAPTLGTPVNPSASPTAIPPASLTPSLTLSPTETATATSQPPTQTVTPIPPTLTPLVVTATLSTSSTVSPAKASKTADCNRILFIADVNYPDGTVVAGGTAVHKTWRLKNAGTCTWTSDYKLVFDTGDLINGPTQVPLPGKVKPGETVDLSVDLTAPTQPGDYRGYWRLQDPSGNTFGMGTSSASFWVEIIVK